MKTSGLVAVLAGASAVEAFLPSPSASLGLRQSRTSCVSKAPVGRQSRAQQHYMVAAPAKEEGTVAAVPHGGSLVDLNLKTDEEKKVRDPLHAFRGMSGGRNFDHVHTTILRLQPGSPSAQKRAPTAAGGTSGRANWGNLSALSGRINCLPVACFDAGWSLCFPILSFSVRQQALRLPSTLSETT